MKIEKLSADKIKVTVSVSDLTNLDIDIKDLYPNSDELHSFLFHIMETIQAKTGFNPYTGQVVVEATPMREGMTILVSKVQTGNQRKKVSADIKRGVTIKARKKGAAVKDVVFYFAGFEDMCMGLCALDRDDVLSSWLYEINSKFAIISAINENGKKGINILREFAVKIAPSPTRVTFVREHGRLVCHGEELWEMAEKIRNLT